MMKQIATGVFTFVLATSASAAVTGYYSRPALHGDQLIFVSEGDLWTASLPDDPSQTIIAHRLTSGDGNESHPVISPDGRKMAFGLRIKGGEHGNAQGILLYDFERAPR